MSVRGKSINVFLMDGEANGRIKATISNWTGVAYKIPRNKLSACKERGDLSQSSVYFLFGPTYQNRRNAVYIGQAGIRKNGGGILARLMEHDKNPDKDYWTEAVVFTTSNNSFGPTELSYLENCFCNMALAANRFDVKNANEPTPGNITEEKESELEEFADYAQLILGVLGYKVFEKEESIPDDRIDNEHKTAPSVQQQIAASTNQVPPLPDKSLKIGEYVRAAMRNLSASGYEFSDAQIKEMCTPEWSQMHFHTKKMFMKKYTDGKIDNLGTDGRPRFWTEVFTFGKAKVLISKEWYERQYELFDIWYNSL